MDLSVSTIAPALISCADELDASKNMVQKAEIEVGINPTSVPPMSRRVRGSVSATTRKIGNLAEESPVPGSLSILKRDRRDHLRTGVCMTSNAMGTVRAIKLQGLVPPQ